MITFDVVCVAEQFVSMYTQVQVASNANDWHTAMAHLMLAAFILRPFPDEIYISAIFAYKPNES